MSHFRWIAVFIGITYLSIYYLYSNSIVKEAQNRVDLFERSVTSSLSFLLSRSITDLLKIEAEDLNREFLINFGRENQVYSQIRILDFSGQEVFRINQENKLISIVPEHELQNKSKRYYFSDIMNSSKEIYTSGIDHNIENGEIQKGEITLRVAKKYTKEGRILFINLSDEYFNTFINDFSNTEIMISDEFYERHVIKDFWSTYPYLLKSVRLESLEHYLVEMNSSYRNLKFNIGLSFIEYRNKIVLGGVLWLFLTLFTIWAYYLYYKGRGDNILYTNLYRQFIDKSLILSMTDVKGKIVYVNDNFCKISGYSASEILGKDHRILNSGFHEKVFFKDMWDTLKSGEVFSAEICNRKKNGDIYWVQSILAPLFSADGKTLGYASVRYDVTEKRKLKIELSERQRENKLLQNAMMANIGQMSAGLSHQFSTPISVLNTSVDLLEDEIQSVIKDTPTGDISVFISNIRDTLEEMTGLMTFIKQLSRIGAKDELDTDDIANLKEVIEHSIMISKQNMSHLDVEIDWEPSDFDIFVNANELLLTQVFLNLLDNTIFVLGKLESKWIKVWKIQEGNTIKVFFQDSGLTPSLEICEQVFTPYFSTKDISMGTGVGLSLCRDILHRYNGDIEIDISFENTTFVLILKLRS